VIYNEITGIPQHFIRRTLAGKQTANAVVVCSILDLGGERK